MILDVAASPRLLDFLELMKTNKEQYPVGSEDHWRHVPTHQKEWYFDDEAFLEMSEIQRRWYSTYSKDDFQIQLRERLKATFNPVLIPGFSRGDFKDDEQRVVWYIVESRQQRWQLLSDAIGLESAPSSFQVYRGSQSADHACLVVRAWLEDRREIAVPHNGLSSWSLIEGNNTTGARFYFFGSRIGTLFPAVAHMDDTFLDVFVDDAYFARHGLEEAEIIVGLGDPDLPIITDLTRCKIQVQGREFGLVDAQVAKNHLLELGFWSENIDSLRSS